MTRISHVDQVLLLLRHQLQRMGKGSRNTRQSRAGAASGANQQSALDRVAILARIEELADEDVEHSLIRALLTDEFGDRLANDPKFQRVVADVHRIISADREAHRMLQQAVAQLKQAGRA